MWRVGPSLRFSLHVARMVIEISNLEGSCFAPSMKQKQFLWEYSREKNCNNEV